MSPHSFKHKPQRVREAIWAWGALPCRDDAFSFNQLEIHTDGSAFLGQGWPPIPLAAGWGALFPLFVFVLLYSFANKPEEVPGSNMGPSNCYRTRTVIPWSKMSDYTGSRAKCNYAGPPRVAFH